MFGHGRLSKTLHVAEQPSEPSYPLRLGYEAKRPQKGVKTKPHKEVKALKRPENKEWAGGAKEETKDGEWKEWTSYLTSPSKPLSFRHPCISTHV